MRDQITISRDDIKNIVETKFRLERWQDQDGERLPVDLLTDVVMGWLDEVTDGLLEDLEWWLCHDTGRLPYFAKHLDRAISQHESKTVAVRQ